MSVNSHNEWDKLKEVIVGTADGTTATLGAVGAGGTSATSGSGSGGTKTTSDR